MIEQPILDAVVEWDNGRPVRELTRLIEKRCGIMRENLYDAAVATMINTLVSLRSMTRKAGARTAKASKPTLTRRGDLRVSFDRKTMHRCLRIGARHNAPVFRPAERVRIIASKNNRNALVFKVRPLHERDSAYYIAADSEADVLNFERNRIGHKVQASGGLAKLAFSLASNRFSTRPISAGKISLFAEVAARRLVKTESVISGRELRLEFRDKLDHAVPALKGGRGAIRTAQMKAANKTHGILSHYCSKYALSRDIGPTPFPEVLKRR